MNKNRKKWERVKKFFAHVKLIDKYLIFIMIILLLESIVSIFITNVYTDMMERVDVVVRTTMASIFGYFISANFLTNDNMTSNNTERTETGIEALPRQNPPLAGGTDSQNPTLEYTPQTPQNSRMNRVIKNRKMHTSRLQIIIVGCLCIISILMLCLIRYYGYDGYLAQDMLIQFRDFVCGCVGFMIGMPSERTPD